MSFSNPIIFKEIEKTLFICALNKINVITVAEEVFYSWNSSYSLTLKIDNLFKENNVVLVGSGFQDIYFSNLPFLVCKGCINIEKIISSLTYNVDNYSKSICDSVGVGLDIKKFQRVFKDIDYSFSFTRFNVEWLVSALGYSIKSISEKTTPVIATESVYSKSLEKLIEKNNIIGSKSSFIAECNEGTIIESELISQINVESKGYVIIKGLPGVELNFKIDEKITTCTAAISRIKQVLASKEKGYIPTFKLGIP